MAGVGLPSGAGTLAVLGDGEILTDGDLKDAATGLSRRDADMTLMRQGELFHQRKPQACPPGLPSRLRLQPIEFVEDLAALFGGHAGTMIFDLNQGMCVLLTRPD